MIPGRRFESDAQLAAYARPARGSPLSQALYREGDLARMPAAADDDKHGSRIELLHIELIVAAQHPSWLSLWRYSQPVLASRPHVLACATDPNYRA